jgi:hypothetical protein
MRNKSVGSEKQKYGLHKEQNIRLYGEWKFGTWKNSRLYGNKKLVCVTNHYYKEEKIGVHMEPKFTLRDITSRKEWKKLAASETNQGYIGNKSLWHKINKDYMEIKIWYTKQKMTIKKEIN